jgi:ribosomal protein S18 acetylase RimI-like enzyme
MSDDTTLIRIAEADLDRLRPLWAAMRDAYVDLTHGQLPIYDEEESWRRRRASYARLLGGADAFLLARERDGELVAYAAVNVVTTSTVFAWSERAGDLETLVVADAERGRGLGARLLQDVREELARRGVQEVVLHVLADNDRAIDFYRREGFRPYLVLMSDAMPAWGDGEERR